MLSETLQLRYIDLMCLRCEGEVPGSCIQSLSFLLRISVEEMQETLDALKKAGLWKGGDIYNWDNRQYKSDSSTPRVQQFRKRSMKRSGNVAETPSESESESDTDKRGKESPRFFENASRKQEAVIRDMATERGTDLEQILADMKLAPPILASQVTDIIDHIKSRPRPKADFGARPPKDFPDDPDLTDDDRAESMRALAAAKETA